MASPQRPRQSSRSARRNDNPNHVPRPRNAFFIFRCEFTRRHAEEGKNSERSPTPEKILSKRAGAAWKALSEEDKRPYRDEAREESKRHGQENPGYRYRPKRTKPPKRRATGPISRREQVESLVQMRESSAAGLLPSPPGGPHSRTSSSPEPDSPVTPRDSSFHSLAHRRSMSLPHLDMALPSSPYSYQHTHFITPVSCASSPGPGPGPLRNGRRASSSRQRSYSPSVYHIPPPDLPFDLEFAGGTPPFASFAPHGSTVSLPELGSMQDLSYYDDGSSTYSTPQISPAASLYDISQPEYFSESLPMQQEPGPSNPAFHRRQRSNTAPSATVSPLAFLSSSLSNWNGEAMPPPDLLPPSRGGGVPTLTISPPEPSLSPGHSPIQVITDDAPFSFGFGMSPSSPTSLIAPSADIDFDRTPRRADFAPNVQELYAPPYAPPPPPQLGFMQAVVDPALAPGEAYALESYTEGLGAFDIAPAIYDMSPFDDIDFSDFLHVSP
ncbi:high mobility group box domain-containing protein [Phanerochaete sordida]|uniref:High mobility group box domain-containing protein n=1 Tax=Phanerochaete sordida TaxID=48140 RepID=A0A9P3LA54_9APHY|nr:high mobility group box domain-containing protein [Phanerochaete sordida]